MASLRQGWPPKAADPTTAPKGQMSFADPVSWIMVVPGKKKPFLQDHNCQAMVNRSAQVIVAPDVTLGANDKKQEVQLTKQDQANTGKLGAQASMDVGCSSEETL